MPDDQHPTEPAPAADSGVAVGGRSLRADCDRCVGLCCVAPAFSASADFAIDKPAGTPCPNLRRDFRCGIHDRLRPKGFPGCAVYDCFGAGQRVAQETFGGRDWRSTPAIAHPMFEVFAVMRQLHELLWHLTEALGLPAARPLRDQLRRALDDTDRLARGGPDDLARLDLSAHRREVNDLLLRASELARAGARPDGRGRPADRAGADRAGGDLIGRNLKNADLRGASLRGAHLIGADLRWADLGAADLTGADLRGANLGGADLATALFLTQAQLDAATGDAGTRLPPGRTRPAHWRPSAPPRPRARRRR